VPAAPRLTPSDWATVVTLYERGEKTLRELAEQFGVSPQAIQKGLKQRGIEKASRLDEVSNEVDDVARKERERRVKQAAQHVETYAAWYNVLAKLAMKKVIDANQAGGIATVNADVLTIKNAIAIIEKARNESWDILGIEDLLGEGSELPDLNVGEYSESELERIREANTIRTTDRGLFPAPEDRSEAAPWPSRGVSPSGPFPHPGRRPALRQDPPFTH
jgi:DNA-binding MarR family transcriptional regulator